MDLHQLRAAAAQAVEAAGADQAVQHPLVQLRVVHTGAELLEGAEGPALVPLRQHRRGEARPHPLQRRQPEPDVLPRHGEGRLRLVDVRRQQGDAVLPALGDVLRHLVLGVQHGGEQGRHVLPGVAALEPRRLVGHDGVGQGVGFVEGVVGEVVDLVIDRLRHGGGDAVGLAAGYAPLGVAVDEGLPLPLHVLLLLFAHGPAHHVRLPQGVPRQLAEDLNHLLLVDDAAVGVGQDGLQQGVLVGHLGGVLGAGQKPGDGVHGPWAVQGDDGADVLNALGLEAHPHPGHPRRLHLEYAGGLALRQHLVHRHVVVRDVLQLEAGELFLHHLHRVVQHGEIAQAQKVHLQ